jgi:hypothetical protein
MHRSAQRSRSDQARRAVRRAPFHFGGHAMAYLPSRQNFKSDAELIECLADHVAAQTRCPLNTSAAERLEAMRIGVKTFLRFYNIVPPSDAFLDELLIELCDWHGVPLTDERQLTKLDDDGEDFPF